MKTLYKFEVFTEKEVDKEILKERTRKNKETGKREKYTETTIEKVKEQVPHLIVIKYPSRSLKEEANLFYSIKFNDYVKMGLLTDSQIAKKELEMGEGLSEELSQKYMDLKRSLVDKEESLLRLITKEEKTDKDIRKKDELHKDIITVSEQINRYERAFSTSYKHTADTKAKEDTLLWWCLNLTYTEEDKESFAPMFDASSFTAKRDVMDRLEDEEDEIYLASSGKISDIVSIFYLMGLEDSESIEETLQSFKENYE